MLLKANIKVDIVQVTSVLACSVWLSWLGSVLKSRRSRVQFLVRARAGVAGWNAYGRQPIDVSHMDISLPPLPLLYK